MIFFSSDHHFGHNNIIRYCNRPFSSTEEMNEKLIENWNKVVGPQDFVYYLGDFSLSFRSVEVYTKRLNGLKLLIPGNHDWNHSYNKKSRTPAGWVRWTEEYQKYGWVVFPEQTVMNIPGLGEVRLCHLPYADVLEGPDKYAKWRPIDDGKVLLCGHVHEKWLTRRSPEGTIMVNVGVDVHNMAPVSLDRIKELITEEKIDE
jgi:calcineurin-like phosphoesterase family protein